MSGLGTSPVPIGTYLPSLMSLRCKSTARLTSSAVKVGGLDTSSVIIDKRMLDLLVLSVDQTPPMPPATRCQSSRFAGLRTQQRSAAATTAGRVGSRGQEP